MKIDEKQVCAGIFSIDAARREGANIIPFPNKEKRDE